MKMPNGKNKYCGPWVIGVLAHRSLNTVERWIQKHRHSKKPVKGMSSHEMRLVLQENASRTLVNIPVKRSQTLQLNFPPFVAHVGPTLLQWVEATKDTRDLSDYYVIIIPEHFVLVKGQCLTDNHVKRWVGVREYRRKSQRVQAIYRVAEYVS